MFRRRKDTSGVSVNQSAFEHIKSLASSLAQSFVFFPPFFTDNFNTDTFSNKIREI